MKKILFIIGILFLVSFMLVPLVSASEVVFFEYTEGGSGTTYHLYNLHPTGGAGASAAAQVFNSTVTGYLTSLQMWGARYGSPGGVLSCRLEGTTDGLTPNGTVYATATNTIDMDSISTTAGYSTFLFNGTYQLTQYKQYAMVVYVSDNTGCTDANEYRIYLVPGVSGTNSARYYSSAWDDWTYDMHWIISGDTSAGVTPTPSPTPDTSSTGDADMEALTDAILPFLVPLLICLIPALLGYKFVGELGFFIGLNVGCILAYVTLESTAYAFPLWGIILVGVMDVAVVLMRR